MWWTSCSKLNFDGRFHRLEPIAVAGGARLRLQHPLRAILSVNVFSEFWHVSEHEPVHLSLVPLTWCVEDSELRAFFDMSLKEDLFDVWQSIEKTVDACSAEMADAAGAVDDAGGAADGADGGADVGPAGAAGAADAPGAAPAKRKRAPRGGGAGAVKARKLSPLEALKKFLKMADKARVTLEGGNDAELTFEEELAKVMEESGFDGGDEGGNDGDGDEYDPEALFMEVFAGDGADGAEACADGAGDAGADVEACDAHGSHSKI